MIIETEPPISKRILNASRKSTLSGRDWLNGSQHSTFICYEYKKIGYYLNGKGIDLPILFTEIKECGKDHFVVKRSDLETDNCHFFHFYSHKLDRYYLLKKGQIRPIQTQSVHKSVSLFFVRINRLFESKNLEKIVDETLKIIEKESIL